MYYQEVSYTTTGTKDSLNLDPAIAPFNASVNVTLAAGTVSYKLQYTLDDFQSPTMVDSDATWVDSVDIPAGTTGNAVASLPFPVSRIRLVIAAIVTGPLKLQVRQGLSTN